MKKTGKSTGILLVFGILFISLAFQPGAVQAAGACTLTAGQVVINEIFPKATDGVDWVELYNTTASPLDLSNCYIDDIAGGGGSPIQIATGETISAHGFWTLDRSSYFNNGGDDVRLLLDDASTVLDAYTYADTVSYDYSWYRSPDGGTWAGTPTASPTKGATNSGTGGSCGTGTWVSGNLEIHHIDMGQGDSALIVGPTGRSLLFDAGEENWNSSAKAQIIGPYIEAVLGCKALDYVVISHFHLDHIGYVNYGGLWNLVETQGFTVGTTLLRDYNSYLGNTSGTFENWKTYLAGSGQTTLHPVTAVEGTSQVDLGPGVTFNIVSLDGNDAIIAGDFSADPSPPSENDYSIGVLLSFGDFDEFIGGDLDGQYEVGGFGYTYHDIELSAAPEVGDVDVYKVNHHASSHSTSPTFIGQIDPEISIVTVGDGNTYGHPTQEVMDRLLATSTVYMTERGELTTDIGSAIVAGNIVIKTSDGSTYTVNGTSYTATEPVRTDVDGDGYFAEVDPADNNPDSIPAPYGGCDTVYQVCSATCQVSTGQVLINEVLPSPSSGPEWLELYNTTASTLNIGYCYVDDIAGGSAAYQIPAGTTIPGYGFWTLARTNYFNNTGDDARFLREDASTLLDSFSFGNTGADLSWYRYPDGSTWATSPTATTTKGTTNNASAPPSVLSSNRVNPSPTSKRTVYFKVTFSEPVTGVDKTDFKLTTTGVKNAAVIAVSGSDAIWTVEVNTGTDNGTIRLDVIDDDTILDATSVPLGGVGLGNGNFTSSQVYTVKKVITLRSQGSYDGWVLESSEFSNKGGSLNAGATVFYLGDNAQDKQYRAILSFNTAGLPDTAVITKAILKIKKQGLVGTNPFNTHIGLKVDIRKLRFGTLPKLQIVDFQALANKNAIATFNKVPTNNWYQTTLQAGAYPFVNRTGLTQFRLRFAKDDNDDLGADYLKFFSGNALLASRPQLVVEYYVP